MNSAILVLATFRTRLPIPIRCWLVDMPVYDRGGVCRIVEVSPPLVGPSRSAIMLGTVPVWSVVLAIIFLNEHWSASLAVGTLLAVAGSILLATDGITKASVLRLGLVLAALTALQFAIRDVLARSVTQESNLDSSSAAAVTLCAGAVVLIGAAVGIAGPREFSEDLCCSMPATLTPGF